MSYRPSPELGELVNRLSADTAYHGAILPDRVAIAWRGYFAGLLEWGLLSVADHDRLLAMLPIIDGDPVNDIMSGRR